MAEQHEETRRLLFARKLAADAAEDFRLLRTDFHRHDARLLGAAEQQAVAIKLRGDFLVAGHRKITSGYTPGRRERRRFRDGCRWRYGSCGLLPEDGRAARSSRESPSSRSSSADRGRGRYISRGR